MLTAAATPKPTRCKAAGCSKRFEKRRSFEVWCSPDCGKKIALARIQSALLVKARADGKADRAKREAMKTLPELLREAQAAFNAFIRLRDAGKPCICCGKPFEPDKLGGSADAGHFLGRGAAPHMRFVEDNVHAQRKNCNRPGGTTRQQFRAGMIERIGIERVEALESDQTPRKYTRTDARQIRDEYRAKARIMKKVE